MLSELCGNVNGCEVVGVVDAEMKNFIGLAAS